MDALGYTAVSIPKRASAKVKPLGSRRNHQNEHVSIPKRASAKVKPSNLSNPPIDHLVSIPKRASAKVKRWVFIRGSIAWSVSIPKRASAKVKPKKVIFEIPDCLVSIPKRASAKVKRVRTPESFAISIVFQSLKGHQPKWNKHRCSRSVLQSQFQSLKGHQPKWNNAVIERWDSTIYVSIPKRASAKVKLVKHWYRASQTQVSIPKRASAKVKPYGASRFLLYLPSFQSLKGHQPKWNLMVSSVLSPNPALVSIPKRASAKVKHAESNA